MAASLTIDLEAEGKQFGELRIPRSTNEAAWTNLVVPVVTVARGEGSTVLLLGGTHGDEYEGQVALLNLARELDPADISGRVVIVPCLSGEASRAGTRRWPDGPDLNRSFPGDPEGSLVEQLASARASWWYRPSSEAASRQRARSASLATASRTCSATSASSAASRSCAATPSSCAPPRLRTT